MVVALLPVPIVLSRTPSSRVLQVPGGATDVAIEAVRGASELGTAGCWGCTTRGSAP